MHADRTDIGAVADHRDHLAEVLFGRHFEQAHNQRLADTLAAHILPHVDAVLSGEAIGGTVAQLLKVAEPQDTCGVDRDQPWPAALSDGEDASLRFL